MVVDSTQKKPEGFPPASSALMENQLLNHHLFSGGSPVPGQVNQVHSGSQIAHVNGVVLVFYSVRVYGLTGDVYYVHRGRTRLVQLDLQRSVRYRVWEDVEQVCAVLFNACRCLVIDLQVRTTLWVVGSVSGISLWVYIVRIGDVLKEVNSRAFSTVLGPWSSGKKINAIALFHCQFGRSTSNFR